MIEIVEVEHLEVDRPGTGCPQLTQARRHFVGRFHLQRVMVDDADRDLHPGDRLADGFKVNALAPGLRATNLNPRAATAGGDPAEAAAGAVRLAQLPDDGPTGQLFSWDGTGVPW